MSTKSSFKVTSGLDVVGNSNVTGDLTVAGSTDITGKLKINGSAGTIGQVLVSGGADADPIWGGNIDDVIVSNNRLWVFGYNIHGQLGDNTRIDRSSPVQTIAGGTVWSKVSCGDTHIAAIKLNGTLWTWGYNNYGQLGDNTIVSKSSPIQTIAGGTNWSSVSCNSGRTAAIKTDGTLWNWGSSNDGYGNNSGQLGDGTTQTKYYPVQTICGGNNWSKVSCGGGHTAAIKTDGTLWVWGAGWNGCLGINESINMSKSSPIQTIAGGTNWKEVSCGMSHTAAIKTDGTLWIWGNNSWGQLGVNSNISYILSPVQTVDGGTNWSKLSCGSENTAAIKTDGTLWTWGYNNYGQLGDNTTIHRSSPVQTIAGGTNWSNISCGNMHTAAIKTDGTLWTWGVNFKGQLGDVIGVQRSSPAQTVITGTNWNSVSSCGYNTAAITF